MAALTRPAEAALTPPVETGRLADTPAEDTVLRRFLLNQADGQDVIVGAVGGRSRRTPDVALSDTGLPSPYLNQATLLRPVLDAADGVLDEVADFYGDGVGLLLSPWPTPDLSGRGWQLVGHPMFVVRGPLTAPPPAPREGVAVRLATSAEDLALVKQIVVDGYPVPELADVPAERVFGTALLAGPVRYRIGSHAGVPVAAVASHVSHGVVNLCLAATLPSARRRGVWQALVDARCADGPGLPAVAFTSDYSRPGFVRMGFLPVMRFTLWLVRR
jgi:hypothetical protein